MIGVPTAVPGMVNPVAVSAEATHDIAHPSRQIVALSPSPCTPISLPPHRGSHCLYTGKVEALDAPGARLAGAAATVATPTTHMDAAVARLCQPMTVSDFGV